MAQELAILLVNCKANAIGLLLAHVFGIHMNKLSCPVSNNRIFHPSMSEEDRFDDGG